MEYTSGEKVYIISKSYGYSYKHVIKFKKRINFKDITYKGIRYKAIVGYYHYHKDGIRHVISYANPVNAGDYYLECDFVTEKELNNKLINIPDEMFEVKW